MTDMSPELASMLRERMAMGIYASEEDALIQGVRLLADRDEAVAAIRNGIATMEQGEGVPLSEAFAEIRRRHPDASE